MSQINPTTSPQRILCVSIPRSGHHYLVSILRRAFGDECFYCEYYSPVECCRAVPCTRGETARIAIQKNHDFDLSVPTNLPGLTYVVQHRNPVMAVLSDREYMARIEDPTRADDPYEFRVWLGRKAAHFRRFWDKWLASAESRWVVIDYADLLERPAAAAERVIAAAGISIEAGRLAEAVRAVSGTVADFPLVSPDIPFEARVMTSSRYFDPELIAVYESMLLDTIDGLKPTEMLPRIETSGHPIRLVYEAALRSAAGAPGEASALLRQAAAADSENPFVHEELSNACSQAGDLSGAVVAAAEALRLRPKNPILLRLLSDAHSARARTELDGAIALGRTLIELSPHDGGHLIHLAALLARRREVGEAAAMAVRAMAESPAEAGVWRECSEILTMAGDVSGALEAVKQALTRTPSVAEFHHHLGNLLARLGDVEDAIRSHRHALDLDPEQAYWRAALANELVAAGRQDEALRLLDDGLGVQPGHEHLKRVRRRLEGDNPTVMHPLTDAARNKPAREDVVAAYRLLLGREPESEQAITGHLKAPDRSVLLRTFVDSAEFRSRVKPLRPPPPPIDSALAGRLADFAPASWPVPGPDDWVDALGVRTRCAFRTTFRDCAGQAFRHPEDSPLEWQVLIGALSSAGDRFCMIELGAGHGPWLARAGVAWRRRYPDRELMLVGLEAEPEHFRFLEQHIADNEIPDACVRLLHAAVSDEDGVAEFEVARLPAADWGTRIVGGVQPSRLPRVANAPHVQVPAMSLKTLAADLGPIDLLHVDIQGLEVAVLRAATGILRDQVRRLLVGTHGRDVEAQLIELLVPVGFQLTNEYPCHYRLDKDGPVLVADGTQVWINQTLTAEK